MGSNGNLLSIEGLSRRFGAKEVVRSLDLSVAPGQRVALWGPNGSGKSTVLRCVAGTLTPSAGSVHVGGHLAGELAARRLVGASLAQERSFYLRLSGRTNLLFFARIRYDDRREGSRAVDGLIEELEIADIAATRVDRCSTGMVQQLGIARALLGDPSVLLLDEPTRSLDADARGRLWGALGRRPHAAALIATHLDEDLNLCDERVSFPV
ncbi:MAG TPA: ABC transporter ATP-binding protein [Gaiellaceae bacterium]|jgi:ABC-type multidrug transport system ATPase subunit|nr:ABC transporter ATP-binding protein [Gaiellaceae bacterium]